MDFSHHTCASAAASLAATLEALAAVFCTHILSDHQGSLNNAPYRFIFSNQDKINQLNTIQWRQCNECTQELIFCKHLGSIQEIQKDQKASVEHWRRANDKAFKIIWRHTRPYKYVMRHDKTSDSNKHTNVGVIQPFPGQRSILPNWVSLVSRHKPQARELQPENHWKWRINMTCKDLYEHITPISLHTCPICNGKRPST